MVDITFMLFIYLFIYVFPYSISFITLCLTLAILGRQNSMFLSYPNSFSRCHVTFMCDCVVTFLCLVHCFISRQFREMESKFSEKVPKIY